jgi:dienelactone hydrolase
MGKTGSLTDETPADIGRQLIMRVTPEFGNAALDAVAKYGMSLPAAQPKYGVMGFCWGGGRSFLHATHAPGLGASVVFYGSPPNAEQMANIKAPVLGLYGGSDARINATIPGADSAMKRLGKSYEYHIFDGAGHGFPSWPGEQRSEREGGAEGVAEGGRVPERKVELKPRASSNRQPGRNETFELKPAGYSAAFSPPLLPASCLL